MTPPPSEVMHGGAQRLPINWVNVDVPPTRMARYLVEPGAVVTLHVHTGKAEYWVITSGSGVVRIGEDRISVSEGDVVMTPPTVPHGLTNTGNVPLIFLNIVAPTGDAPITSVELESA
ncbi:MAG: cupin domain-containing protein [Devosia sp.]|jgi:mannose-6-phosphate isomerase-like protein (cupin superfamily)|nr:cupin domain-containing protein [Devosia sp.]